MLEAYARIDELTEAVEKVRDALELVASAVHDNLPGANDEFVKGKILDAVETVAEHTRKVLK